MAIPVKGEEPGAFVLTSRNTGKKYVISEDTLQRIIARLGEEALERRCDVKWVVLTQEERKLAEEIREKYMEEK